MALYCGIDLHASNSYVVVLDEADRVVVGQRLPNELVRIEAELAPHREELVGVAVESTFNWYWLVEGLMEAGYRLQLVNTTAVQQYSGLKFRDDRHDARWLAHLLRLGLLPTGYIYPRQDRAVRDLLRKRAHLVRQRTANYLSLHNLWIRNTGQRLRGNRLKGLGMGEIRGAIAGEERRLAMASTLAVLSVLEGQIDRLERAVLKRARRHESFERLLGICGVGKILAMTILYETGDIGRFARVGDYVSYCRCVAAQHLSAGKKKAEGNRRNGNRYLSWAFVEAAHFARRYNARAQRYYERQAARKPRPVAVRCLAHKLARAAYYVMREPREFDPVRLFG